MRRAALVRPASKKASKGAVAKGSGPLHTRVHEALASRVMDGRWPVGCSLPPEVDLASEYGVSRHTLRHALTGLAEQGLIVRKRGAGTRVVSRQVPRSYSQTVHSVDDILRYPTHTYREAVVGEMLECDAQLHQWLGAPVGSSWYHIGAIRRDQTSQHAVAWTDIYVLPRYADVVKRRDHARTMVYQQIEAAHGVAIDRAEVDIFPERLGAAHAKQLGVAKSAPALVIVRRYFDGQGELFEVTLTRHPEKRFVYRMEFQRNVKD